MEHFIVVRCLALCYEIPNLSLVLISIYMSQIRWLLDVRWWMVLQELDFSIVMPLQMRLQELRCLNGSSSS